MVISLSHAGIGLLIVLYLGLRGRESKLVVLFSILPDFDVIPYSLFLILENKLDHETRNILFYLMGHREFMHSVLFFLITILILHKLEKNSRLTIACSLAMFSHLYLDYATSWKMRPFFPFVKESSTLGAFYFFDPLVTVISLIPFFILLMEYQRKKGKWPITEPIHEYVQQNKRFIIVSIICIFVIWCSMAPLIKLLLINQVSAKENNLVSYQNTAPISPGKFIGTYRFNETHYKIFEITYWNGICRSDFIPEKSFCNITDNNSVYISRAALLYDSGLPKEIDYPVYNITENSTTAIVTISDARSVYVKYWAYYKVQYTFVFDKQNSNFAVFVKDLRKEKRPVALNRFIKSY